MYHYVRDLKHSRYPRIKGLDAALFREQVAYLKKHYTCVSVDDVVDAARAGAPLPENAALLTFDDGYSDHFDFVFPILKKEKTECSGKACDDDREKPAALMLLELLKASEERVILLSTGPLTDLAHTLRIRPGLSKKIEKVILLCGRDMIVDRGIHVYDNIRRDPEAMQIILDSGVDTLLVTPADDDEQKTLKAAVRYAAGEESFMDIRNEHCLIQLGNIGTGALVMDRREKPEEVNCRIVRG